MSWQLGSILAQSLGNYPRNINSMTTAVVECQCAATLPPAVPFDWHLCWWPLW